MLYSLAELTEGYTQAELAGLVRQAQTAALYSAINAGTPDQAMITMSDLMDPMRKTEGGNLTVAECSGLQSIYAGMY